MKILIAPDKFKGTLSSREAARAVAEGIRKSCPQAVIETLIVSDGGQGFIEALEQAERLTRHRVRIPGPLGKNVPAYFGISGNRKRVYIESCHATGFHLVPGKKRNPFLTSSAGLAVLLKRALALNPAEIYVGLGSSATCDAGIPVARKFGYQFYDEKGRTLTGNPCELERIRKIKKPSRLFTGKTIPKIYAVSDAFNPPVGKLGGVRIYSPQKGARPAQVLRLEKGIKNLLAVIQKSSGRKLSRLRGGGAAGCLALGLHFFFGARIVPGTEFVFKKLRLREKIRNAAVIVTGEGSFDEQSFYGKIAGKIVKTARKHGKTIFLVTGRKRIPQKLNRRIDGSFSVEAIVNKGRKSSRMESSAALRKAGKALGDILKKDPFSRSRKEPCL
ncbi:MAG TPA: glycerate kinase [Candidatus Omnitrophota bacterium]|nr:glycerate kinase [Candidatus Omnitrophota bacterium]